MTTPDEHDLDLTVDALRQRRLADHEHGPHTHTMDDSEHASRAENLRAAQRADWYDRYDEIEGQQREYGTDRHYHSNRHE